MGYVSCITQSLFILPGTQTSDVLLYQDGRKLVGLATTKNKQKKRVEIHITKTEDKEKHKLLEQHQSCCLPLCHDLAELVTTVVNYLSHSLDCSDFHLEQAA